MAEFIETNHDEEFLYEEAKGTRSRETVTLAQSARVYQSGDIVINTGAGGSYVLATNALVDANANADVSIVARRKNATAGAKKVAAIFRQAEVKAAHLTFGASTVLGDLTAALAKKDIIVRYEASA